MASIADYAIEVFLVGATRSNLVPIGHFNFVLIVSLVPYLSNMVPIEDHRAVDPGKLSRVQVLLDSVQCGSQDMLTFLGGQRDVIAVSLQIEHVLSKDCLLYTSPSPRDS